VARNVLVFCIFSLASIRETWRRQISNSSTPCPDSYRSLADPPLKRILCDQASAFATVSSSCCATTKGWNVAPSHYLFAIILETHWPLLPLCSVRRLYWPFSHIVLLVYVSKRPSGRVPCVSLLVWGKFHQSCMVFIRRSVREVGVGTGQGFKPASPFGTDRERDEFRTI
jgi:hypothetical protein